MAKILRLQRFFLTMQKFLHDAAKITFCSLDIPGYSHSSRNRDTYVSKAKKNLFKRFPSGNQNLLNSKNNLASFQFFLYIRKNYHRFNSFSKALFWLFLQQKTFCNSAVRWTCIKGQTFDFWNVVHTVSENEYCTPTN